MLGIILQILKIIGIILLVVSGLVLTAVTAVLFIPVRYRLKVSAHPSAGLSAKKTLPDAFLRNEIRMEAGVSWLFHFLHVSFRLLKKGITDETEQVSLDAGQLKENMSCRLCILGIPVMDFLHPKPKKKKKKKRNGKKAKKEAVSESPSSLEQKTEGRGTGESGEKKPSENAGEKNGAAQADSGQSENGDSRLKQFAAALKKLFEKIRHIKYTVIELWDRLKEAAQKAGYYKEIFTGPDTKAARDKAAAQLKRFGAHIKPSVFHAELSIGTPDPAVMGDILMVFGFLIPLFGNTVFVTPYFDRYAAELELKLKGRMTVFVLLLVLWKLKFDADINQAWDLLKNPRL